MSFGLYMSIKLQIMAPNQTIVIVTRLLMELQIYMSYREHAFSQEVYKGTRGRLADSFCVKLKAGSMKRPKM